MNKKRVGLVNHAIDSHYCMSKCFRHVNRHNYLVDFKIFPDSQRLKGISDRADINLWPLYASDTDGFMIPSLEIGDLDQKVEASKPPSPKVSRKNPTLFITKDKGKNTLSVDYGNATGNMAKGSTRDWLDPHCHES
ncbi:hypothetical protein CFP56_019292 [Quercus suber]|uniref:Uncharacterized protein n=1 Tax=Quercus suber TaxID=58331 RepID=A0AAW0KJS7_QUESU